MESKKIMKRVLSLLLVAVTIFSLSVTAFAKPKNLKKSYKTVTTSSRGWNYITKDPEKVTTNTKTKKVTKNTYYYSGNYKNYKLKMTANYQHVKGNNDLNHITQIEYTYSVTTSFGADFKVANFSQECSQSVSVSHSVEQYIPSQYATGRYYWGFNVGTRDLKKSTVTATTKYKNGKQISYSTSTSAKTCVALYNYNCYYGWFKA